MSAELIILGIGLLGFVALLASSPGTGKNGA
jgi:hypothetical protein